MSIATKGAALMRHPDKLFIGGAWVAPSSSAKIRVTAPATEEVWLEVAEANAQDMSRAVAAARAAFDRGPWPRLSHAERADYLRKIAEKIGERTGDIALGLPQESGILHLYAKGSAGSLGRIYSSFADMAQSFPWVSRHVPGPTGGGGVGLLAQEPVGVVGAIIPWNGPPVITAYKVAPALLAGCTVVVKLSPEAPSAGYILAEVIEEIGLPPGAVNILAADREASEALVSDPRVDKITFTGSNAVGKRIASICSDRLARVTLELGGKSAGVILDDYDVAKAAETISRSARVLTGQVCYALTRIIVPRARHDDFVGALSESYRQIRIGDPFADDVDMGPLATARQRDRVEGYIAKGVEEGAILATGGRRPSRLNRGYFIEPTVFGQVDNRSAIAQEEIFGPVMSVIPAESEEEAIRMANDTIFGLNASVFTNDSARAYAVSRQLQSGTVGHNGFRTDATIAFGGVKQSGLGREGGEEGLRAFLESKTILLDQDPGAI